LLFFCFLKTSLTAQSVNNLVNREPVEVDEVDVLELRENQLAISMPFAKELILNPEQKKLITEKVVIKIELVYTKYRTTNSFNQKQLNKDRLEELKHLTPHLFSNRLWDFELISQTKGNSREVCDKMFHGFVLTFRPNSVKKTLNSEADYLKDVVASMLEQDSLDNDTTPLKYRIKTRYDLKIGYVHDTVWYVDTVQPPLPPNFFYLQSLYNDTTVLSSFNRNKSWKNFIVVTDVTGSMSPYSAQVFVWLKAQGKNQEVKYFVFFNDGDETESIKKKPLATKGVYVTENKGIKVVMKEATKYGE